MLTVQDIIKSDSRQLFREAFWMHFEEATAFITSFYFEIVFRILKIWMETLIGVKTMKYQL